MQKQQYLKIRIPASTTNLGAGYDCLGMALKLHNYFEVRTLDSGKSHFYLQGIEGYHEMAPNKKNLVYKALNRVTRKTGVTLPPLEIKIHINIPIGRGLGSSATAIIGGMVTANILSGSKKLTEDVLLREIVKMEGHPDNIIASYCGGLTAVMLAGKQIIYKRYRPNSKIKTVILVPEYDLPTLKAREILPEKVDHKDAVKNLTRVPFIIDRLCSGDLSNLAEIMDDRLHEPYRKKFIKHFDKIRRGALDAGANAVLISGAGPSIAAFCIDDTEKIATAMSSVLTNKNIHNSTLILSPDSQGTRILSQK